ncbi:MAG: flagellar basal body rod protein FlgB [Magnetococcales bacterium]|nr:flagellar basal body rod protein FlgB [Magnetococcales bacterium]
MSGFGLLGQHGAFKANLMDLRQRRQEIIGANVANGDTPGYKARRLDFEDKLKEAMPLPGELKMAKTSKGHMPTPYFGAVAGDLQEVETPIPKGDRNSVDLEQEMSRQTANQLLYNYATQSFNGQVGILKMVIDGGQR